jgi:hypothetical protein
MPHHYPHDYTPRHSSSGIQGSAPARSVEEEQQRFHREEIMPRYRALRRYGWDAQKAMEKARQDASVNTRLYGRDPDDPGFPYRWKVETSPRGW